MRTAWLYGLNGRSFVTTILKHAREKDELRVVDDQYGSPTWTANLSCAMWALIRANAHGIVHAAGSGACTWCDFAREIVSLAGLETRVTAITSDELERPARRPANSTLDTTKLRGLTGFSFPDWRDSLKTFMGEMNEQGPTTSF